MFETTDVGSCLNPEGTLLEPKEGQKARTPEREKERRQNTQFYAEVKPGFRKAKKKFE